jgi:hypothetical protein
MSGNLPHLSLWDWVISLYMMLSMLHPFP